MINVSFFSYKGGSGRTTLTYNTMSFLIKELKPTANNPIILIDLDIDSKGMSYLLDRTSAINTIQVLRGEIQDLNSNPGEVPISKHPFFQSLANVGTAFGLPASEDNAVRFISAKSTNKDNRYINNTSNYDAGGVGLKGLSDLCEKYQCKALVMDTPAGEQLATESAFGISEVIVTVLRITKQFRDGTVEFLRYKSNRYNGKKFIIVPNAVPEIMKIGNMNFDNVLSMMENMFINVSNTNEINIDFIKNRRGINEVQLFKFIEANLFVERQTRELTSDEEKAIQKYEQLANLIIENESN